MFDIGGGGVKGRRRQRRRRRRRGDGGGTGVQETEVNRTARGKDALRRAGEEGGGVERGGQHSFSASLQATHNRRSEKKEKLQGDDNTEVQNTPLSSQLAGRRAGWQAGRQADAKQTHRSEPDESFTLLGFGQLKAK